MHTLAFIIHFVLFLKFSSSRMKVNAFKYKCICTYVRMYALKNKLSYSQVRSTVKYPTINYKKNRYAQLLNLIYFIFLSIAIATDVAFIS